MIYCADSPPKPVNCNRCSDSGSLAWFRDPKTGILEVATCGCRVIRIADVDDIYGAQPSVEAAVELVRQNQPRAS